MQCTLKEKQIHIFLSSLKACVGEKALKEVFDLSLTPKTRK